MLNDAYLQQAAPTARRCATALQDTPCRISSPKPGPVTRQHLHSDKPGSKNPEHVYTFACKCPCWDLRQPSKSTAAMAMSIHIRVSGHKRAAHLVHCVTTPHPSGFWPCAVRELNLYGTPCKFRPPQPRMRMRRHRSRGTADAGRRTWWTRSRRSARRCSQHRSPASQRPGAGAVLRRTRPCLRHAPSCLSGAL